MTEPVVLKTGTTTIGLVCKDGIVLAADKRMTAGGMVAGKDMSKIVKLSDNVATTIAGNVSDIQLQIKVIKAQLKLKELRSLRKVTVKETVELLSGMVYQAIRRMSTMISISHFILGGNDNTGSHLYDLSPDGSLKKIDEWVSSGSGSTFAMGVLETLYKKDMSVNEGIDLAYKGIKAAIERDTYSGNGISLFTITKDGVKEYANDNIEYNYVSKNIKSKAKKTPKKK